MMQPHFRVRTVLAVALSLVLMTTGACVRRQTNRAVDPTNELPFGAVDTPVQNATVKLITDVGGWAVDDRGIREIRLYVDGHFVNSTAMNTPRPDVARDYPQFRHDTDVLGFSTVVEFPSKGPHALLVQAVDTDGATRDIGTIKVTVNE